MSDKNSIEKPTIKSIDSYVRKHASQIKESHGHQQGASETIREVDYKGHHIVVRTSYQIEVDGKPVTGHMGVTDDGKVHYHPVPNMSFASAIDMTKQLIDVFPDDFNDTGSKSDTHANHESKAHDK